MTRPRRILKGEVVMGTRRCSERRFFLRPGGTSNHIFMYCLARACRITGVLLHEFQVLSNHYHIVFTDVHGNRAKFFQELNAFVARAVNRTFGHWESFFAPGSYNAPVLLDGNAIEKECLYTLCNAVEAGLVSSPEYWEGVCSWSMEYGDTKVVRRPEGFFRESMREEEVLELHRPEDLYPELDDDEARAKLRDKAKQYSKEFAKELRAKGGGFMGMKRVRKQPLQSSPTTREPRRGIKPTVAGNKWKRIEALRTNKKFYEEHREARQRFEAGERDVEFPAGTYLMAKRFRVAVKKK